MPLSLPHDLVIALNLSRTDLEVFNTVASHRWSFATDRERELWRAAHEALAAMPADAEEHFDDRVLLATCLHSPAARKLVRRLDDCGVLVLHIAAAEHAREGGEGDDAKP